MEKKIDSLVEKYIEGKVPEAAYQRKLAEFEAGKKLAKKIIDGIDERAEERIDELDQDLDFAKKAREEFENGGDAKRRVIMRLGSNFVLLDHTLDIVLKEPLERVKEIAPLINAAAEKFEPLKNADNSRQFKDYLSSSIEMGPIPRNTSLDLDSGIVKSIERILSAFDDAVQVGLVKLRLSEIAQVTAIGF